MKKSILITGSTDGIGKLAATKLAKAGHNVYLHGRDKDKLEQVLAEIKATATGEVTGFIADLSDLNAVKEMATDVMEKLDTLDVLINNAGVFKTSNPIAKNGLDIRFVVNYLAPYVLTNALLPLLESSNHTDSPSRVINLSSAAQLPVSFAALSGDAKIEEDRDAYGQSKLALTMWSMWLADSLVTDDKNVHVIAVNPGSLLNTSMVSKAYGKHWAPMDKGADILFDLATAADFEAITGQYFDNDLNGTQGNTRGDFGTPHPDALNQKAKEELVEHTAKLLHKLGF